jgi:outer membrane biosynthesis protein TonB
LNRYLFVSGRLKTRRVQRSRQSPSEFRGAVLAIGWYAAEETGQLRNPLASSGPELLYLVSDVALPAPVWVEASDVVEQRWTPPEPSTRQSPSVPDRSAERPDTPSSRPEHPAGRPSPPQAQAEPVAEPEPEPEPKSDPEPEPEPEPAPEPELGNPEPEPPPAPPAPRPHARKGGLLGRFLE